MTFLSVQNGGTGRQRTNGVRCGFLRFSQRFRTHAALLAAVRRGKRPPDSMLTSRLHNVSVCARFREIRVRFKSNYAFTPNDGRRHLNLYFHFVRSFRTNQRLRHARSKSEPSVSRGFPYGCRFFRPPSRRIGKTLFSCGYPFFFADQ